MKSDNNVEETIKKKLSFIASTDLHDRMLNDVLNAQEKSNKIKSATTGPRIGRIIMKNSITKLIAAVVIVIAVLISISQFGGSATGVVWGEVLEMAEQTPTVVFDMTVEIGGPEGKKLVLPSKNYIAGDYGTRSDIFFDGKLSMVKYRLPAKKIAYQISVGQKKYLQFELSDEQSARDSDDPRTWLKMILSGDYTKLGRTTINGVTAEGIECKRPDMVGKDGIMRLWVDVETNLPVQIIVETLGMEGGQIRPHKFVMENFEWNVSLDESIFEPNIPDDYTQVEEPRASHDRQESSKAQQTHPQILAETGQEQASRSKVKEAVRKFFNACTVQDWDTVSNYLPYMKIDQRIKDINAGLETMYIGEPSRAANGKNWLVSYEIKFKGGGIQKNTMELKEDENTGQFIILGGF
jgi:hypothetical protein